MRKMQKLATKLMLASMIGEKARKELGKSYQMTQLDIA